MRSDEPAPASLLGPDGFVAETECAGRRYYSFNLARGMEAGLRTRSRVP
jgi:hypothetical protein